MPQEKKPRVKTRRVYLSLPGGQPGKPGGPGERDDWWRYEPFWKRDLDKIPELTPDDSTTLKPELIPLEPPIGQGWIWPPPPYPFPEIGDTIEHEGYIDFLRIDEKGYTAGHAFNPATAEGIETLGDYHLELETYCVIGLSEEVDKSTRVKEYRVLYSDPKGEELAVSMAVIAALKDAFINRSKVKLHGILSEFEIIRFIYVQPQSYTSEKYNELNSITLLRS